MISLVNSIQHLKEKMMLILYSLFLKIKTEGLFPIYKASIHKTS